MKVVKTVSKTDNEEVTEELTVLSGPAYDLVKRLVQVALPAFASLYFGLAQIWDFPAGEEVVGSTALLTTFLGVVLGISKSRYDESDAPHDGELVVHEDPGGVASFSLELAGDPELLADKTSISFKVRRQSQ